MFARLAAKIKGAYYKARRPGIFLKLLLGFQAGWYSTKYLIYYFDAGNGWMNLILSEDASIMSAMLYDLMLLMLTQDRSTMSSIKTEVHEMHEEVEEIQDDVEEIVKSKPQS